MKITYIHHSAFLAELETVTLLFDYTEGTLPKISDKKPLLVFASHRHGDHYSEKILELIKEHEKTRYILSDDISKGRLPKELLDEVVFMKPGERIGFFVSEGNLTGPVTEGEKADAEVLTFRSTDEGVAFLIKAEGKTIYHAGDLNNWRWEGEPESWNDQMAKQYSKEVDKLSGMHIDAAFLPLDPRQEKAFLLGFDEFMRKIRVSHAFPMHFWGDFSVIGRLKDMDISAPYRNRIVEIREDGESFEIG
ncbi:MAG: MBL fold metallo-hydrolase [Hungatella sp.]|nr:MBL fold metallo-hydrolase [Hungatella sp.]